MLKSHCGSLPYCAPEILNSSPYFGIETDIWASGVILFAILTGNFPFDQKGQQESTDLIKKCDYTIPKNIHPFAKHLIQSLLVLNPKERPSAKEILTHDWLN